MDQVHLAPPATGRLLFAGFNWSRLLAMRRSGRDRESYSPSNLDGEITSLVVDSLSAIVFACGHSNSSAFVSALTASPFAYIWCAIFCQDVANLTFIILRFRVVLFPGARTTLVSVLRIHRFTMLLSPILPLLLSGCVVV